MVVICEIRCLKPSEQGCLLSRFSHVHLFATPWNYSPPGSLSMGILQARILERAGISSSRGSSWSRDWTHTSCVSCAGRQILYHWTTRESLLVPQTCTKWWTWGWTPPTSTFPVSFQSHQNTRWPLRLTTDCVTQYFFDLLHSDPRLHQRKKMRWGGGGKRFNHDFPRLYFLRKVQII